MPRHARIVIPVIAHYVTQRGNHRKAMFFYPEGRLYFLDRLAFYAAKSDLPVASYCLMTTHTHLVVIPSSEDSLAKTFKPLHMCYSQRLNKRAERTGLNWQGRFFSSPMDELHTWLGLAAGASRELHEELKNIDGIILKTKFESIIKLAHSNLPIGSSDFIKRLEQLTGKCLSRGHAGRKRSLSHHSTSKN